MRTVRIAASSRDTAAKIIVLCQDIGRLVERTLATATPASRVGTLRITRQLHAWSAVNIDRRLGVRGRPGLGAALDRRCPHYYFGTGPLPAPIRPRATVASPVLRHREGRPLALPTSPAPD
jgi:hypothetical protein